MKRKYSVTSLVVFASVFVLVTTGLIVLAVRLFGGVTPDDDYRSASSLASALDSEGFRCDPVGEPAVIADGYGEEIHCHTGMGVSVWEDDLPDHAQDPSILFILGGSVTGIHYVVHDTWAVSVEREAQADAIQEVFGGQIVGPNQELMDLIEEFG